MDSIEKCIVKRALYEQEIQKRLKRLNDKKLQIQEYKAQAVKALDASLGNIENSGIVSVKGNANISENDCSKTKNDQSSEKQSSTSRNESSWSGNVMGVESNKNKSNFFYL
ncbi:hypothetical protein Tco_0604331 [Tanacetum coccineum]